MRSTWQTVSEWSLAAVVGLLVLGLIAALYMRRDLQPDAIGRATPWSLHERGLSPGVLDPARPGPGGAALHVTGPEPAERIPDLSAYRLGVWGKAGRELSLTLDEVRALPAAEVEASLQCVVGWIDDARWRGAPVREVIRAAEPLPEAGYLVFRDDRDFSATLSMGYVRTGGPILAYELNGAPLPADHGRPLRVVAPGKYGYKWVKWVTEIELSDRGYEGTYEERGFSLNGNVDEPETEWLKRRQ